MQGVMALHQLALHGSTPIGALAMGWVIQTTSPRAPFVLAGLAALACAAHWCGPVSRLATIDADDMPIRRTVLVAIRVVEVSGVADDLEQVGAELFR